MPALSRGNYSLFSSFCEDLDVSDPSEVAYREISLLTRRVDEEFLEYLKIATFIKGFIAVTACV